MRLSKEMIRDLSPFIRMGSRVRLGYPKGGKGKVTHRQGVLENIGNGPLGPNITLSDGDKIRTFSISKVTYVDLMNV